MLSARFRLPQRRLLEPDTRLHDPDILRRIRAVFENLAA